MTRRAAAIVIAITVAAMAAIAVFSIPGSPLEKRPTSGSTSRAAEVTLQAVAPRDRDLTQEDLDRSVSIMRDRVDKLGVAEPRSARRATTASRSSSRRARPGSSGCGDHRQDRKLELFDLQANLVAPSVDARTRQPIATAKLYDLLAGQQALANAATRTRTTSSGRRARSSCAGPWRRRKPRSRSGAASFRPATSFAVPPETVVLRCGGGGAQVCPGVNELQPTGTSWYLFRFTPPDVPEMTGDDLDLSGTRQDFDTRTGEPIVLMQFTDDGAKQFEAITRARRSAGSSSSTRSAAVRATRARSSRTSRSCSTARSGRGLDRLRAVPGRDLGSNGAQITGLDSIGEARTSPSCSRPAPSGRVPDARADGHLGDARQGLARGGQGGAPPA